MIFLLGLILSLVAFTIALIGRDVVDMFRDPESILEPETSYFPDVIPENIMELPHVPMFRAKTSAIYDWEDEGL